ncbi:MAG: Clp protease N-terminal domain-containing protein [Myxococcota bacterium]
MDLAHRSVSAMHRLIALFAPHCGDRSTLDQLAALCREPARWPDSGELLQRIQDKAGTADTTAWPQYRFEEAAARLLRMFAEVEPSDLEAAYAVVPHALSLAAELSIPPARVVDIVRRSSGRTAKGPSSHGQKAPPPASRSAEDDTLRAAEEAMAANDWSAALALSMEVLIDRVDSPRAKAVARCSLSRADAERGLGRLVVDQKRLMRSLDQTCSAALEAAIVQALNATHHEITIEHVLVALITDAESSAYRAARQLHIGGPLLDWSQRRVARSETGHQGKPTFHPLCMAWLQDAWIVGLVAGDGPVLNDARLLAQLRERDYLGPTLNEILPTRPSALMEAARNETDPDDDR